MLNKQRNGFGQAKYLGKIKQVISVIRATTEEVTVFAF